MERFVNSARSCSRGTLAAIVSVITAAILCTGFLVAVSLGATVTENSDLGHSRFTLTENSVSEFFRMKGTWVCYLGDSLAENFSGAAKVSLLKEVGGSVVMPTTKQANISGFSSATSNIDFIAILVGDGLYQWAVTDGDVSTSITADCVDAN